MLRMLNFFFLQGKKKILNSLFGFQGHALWLKDHKEVGNTPFVRCILKFVVKSPADQQFLPYCDGLALHYLPKVSKLLHRKVSGSRDEATSHR